VRIIDDCKVSQLCAHNDRITGVVLRYRSGKEHEEALSAYLIVDASGRGLRAPQWLNSLGYGNVQETSVKIDIGYTTRIYRCPAQLPANWKVLLIFGRPPDDKRGGVIFPIQGGYWIVTLTGSLRDHPPDDEADLLEFACSLIIRLAYMNTRRRCCRKDRSINPYILASKQFAIAPSLETDAPERDRLAECGFTGEEIVALLWLRHWYQSGGSDRMPILRHWEFLKLLVMTGRLEV